MLDISVSKFHEVVPLVENKVPHRLHARLEQTPSESHPQICTRHTTVHWGRTDFFNDNFGRLTGTKPLFWGTRVGVTGPFFTSQVTILLINRSMDKISTLHWACWGVNSWRTDLKLMYDFPRVLIWQCMVSFDALNSFFGFSSKTLRIFSISYNLSLPEHAKSLVFSFPVLKCLNHRFITHSLINLLEEMCQSPRTL